jgi:FkbM family methyltransferase
MNKYKIMYWNLRRKILKIIIPEFFWPRYVNIEGTKFKIRNTPYSFGTKREIVKGEYEIAERILLKDEIIAGDVIIEMGGSIGVITALLQNMTGKKGFVVSIEASSKLSAYSRSWLESDNTKIIHGYAFPVYKLEQLINVSTFDESGPSLGGTVKYEIGAKNNDINMISDGIYDINKVCDQFQIIPTVLMIDIEGSEKILLSQKPNFPKSIRSIIIELHPNTYSIEVQNLIIQSIYDDGFVFKKQVSTSYLFSRN